MDNIGFKRPRKSTSQVVGVRTGKHVLKGKNIRKCDDGTDVFKDYFAETFLQSENADYFPTRNQNNDHEATKASGSRLLERENNQASSSDDDDDDIAIVWEKFVQNKSAPTCMKSTCHNHAVLAEKSNKAELGLIDVCDPGHSEQFNCPTSANRFNDIACVSSRDVPKQFREEEGNFNHNNPNYGHVSGDVEPKERAAEENDLNLPYEDFSFLGLGMLRDKPVDPNPSHSQVLEWLEDGPEPCKQEYLESMPSTSGIKKKRKNMQDEVPETAVRRSSRIRHQPLDYWRNERVLYKFTKSGDIENLGVDPGTTDYAAWNGPQGNVKRMKKKKKSQAPLQLNKSVVVYDPDVSEFSKANIIMPFKSLSWINPEPEHIFKGVSVTRTVESLDHTFGFVRIQGLKKKPPMVVQNHNINFVIMDGVIEVTIHDTSFTMKRKDVFVVPNGNCYSLQNLCCTEALLVYTSFVNSVLHKFKV